MIKFRTLVCSVWFRSAGMTVRSLSSQAANSEPIHNINFTRLDNNSSLLSQTILKVKSRKTRKKSNLILIEGRRLIQDAINAKIQPQMIFFSRLSDVAKLNNLSGETQIYKVPYNDIKLWSDLVTSPGIIGIFEIPHKLPATESLLPVTVICDQIREPGNLGSLLRNAAAAGVAKVVLTTGCVDPWDPKVLRGGSGAHFKVPFIQGATWPEISSELDPSTRVVLADSSTEEDPLRESIPLIPYFALDYKSIPNLAVIIGGETEGLSEEAFALTRNFCGCRVSIPLSNHIESLNSAAAAGIILFELKRQFMS